MRKKVLAVAALTVVAAFVYQHHRGRQLLRAAHAEALVERLTAQRAHGAYEARVRRSVDRLMADSRAVDAATAVIDGAWARYTEGGDDDV